MSNTTAPTVFYRKFNVEGLDIFYREAGLHDRPTVLLLHGFPSSSHMFRNLIPILADKYGHILRKRAVAIPIREAEHPLPNRQPRRAIAQSGDHPSHFVSGDRTRAVTDGALGTARGPGQLIPRERRRMNL